MWDNGGWGKNNGMMVNSEVKLKKCKLDKETGCDVKRSEIQPKCRTLLTKWRRAEVVGQGVSQE